MKIIKAYDVTYMNHNSKLYVLSCGGTSEVVRMHQYPQYKIHNGIYYVIKSLGVKRFWEKKTD